MAEHWFLLGALILSTLAIRASGPVILGGRALSTRAIAVISLLAPALLAALVVTQTLSEGTGLIVDERLAGVGAAGGAIALRASPITAVVVAAAVTAALRAV